ncbi:DNA polymerase III subunit delta' [Inhella gelatinilytica]|uniref:DNA polymerase III subunit delta n=1 Tax=Inhella gelatinilytica TaxID=2795030 RepID=A0A931IWV6_9BURK|nr:DNA polymerase III subunit delta' [Inhella gelatinilytica]MBH9553046.1 DNA polymerase III subunit delta' [Inhella gelatinilytica]
MLPSFLQPALRQALSLDKAHAVLLSGPPGLGQWELAQALAQAWLCENNQAGEPACGQCAACHLVDQRSHPDQRWCVPAALRVAWGWEEGPSEGKAKPSQEIRIDEIRALASFTQSTTARGQGKVLGLHPAEAMNTVAANALLKTLEEPGGRLRFVLSCSAPHELLPTIRSRCQSVELTPPSESDALLWLTQSGVAVDEAPVLLRLAGGLPGLALRWHGAGMRRALVEALPGGLQKGELGPAEAWGLSTVIDVLGRLAHDQLRRTHGALPRYFPLDCLPVPSAPARLQRWAAELRAARAKGDHPLTPGLWMETLAAQAQRGLHVPAARALHSRP